MKVYLTDEYKLLQDIIIRIFCTDVMFSELDNLHRE